MTREGFGTLATVFRTGQRGRWLRAALALVCGAGVVSAPGGSAHAFPYVMKKGETLADVASRFYGRVELERVLVPANALDAQSGSAVVPGMRIEIPAVSYHTTHRGDSWEAIAERYLGSKRRGEALAVANGTWPWIPPDVGREILIPFNLRYVVKRGDSTPSIAYEFLEKRDDAFVLDRYNDLKGEPVEPGDVILVPLSSLALTDEGKRAAKEGLSYVQSEGEGDDRDAQDAAATGIPDLEKEVATGKYVAAIARGSAMLGSGKLTDNEVGRIERQLVEAFVAEGSEDLAEEACRGWRKVSPDATLDPIEVSPKILRACTPAMLGSPSRAPEAPSSSAAPSPPQPKPPHPPAPRISPRGSASASP